MQKWEYTEFTQVRGPKTGDYHWSAFRNHKMHAIIRLAKLSEYGWELALLILWTMVLGLFIF